MDMEKSMQQQEVREGIYRHFMTGLGIMKDSIAALKDVADPFELTKLIGYIEAIEEGTNLGIISVKQGDDWMKLILEGTLKVWLESYDKDTLKEIREGLKEMAEKENIDLEDFKRTMKNNLGLDLDEVDIEVEEPERSE